MRDTEWFQGRRVDEHPRPIIFPLISWLAAIGFTIFLLVLISGCATTKEDGPRNEVCLFRLLGNTEDGVPVVNAICVTPEAFAESQK